jgi:hypothetical protein
MSKLGDVIDGDVVSVRDAGVEMWLVEVKRGVTPVVTHRPG